MGKELCSSAKQRLGEQLALGGVGWGGLDGIRWSGIAWIQWGGMD